MSQAILTLDRAYLIGTATQSSFGTGIDACQVNYTGLNGGFATAAVRIPNDADLSRSISLYHYLAPFSQSTNNGLTVNLLVYAAHFHPNLVGPVSSSYVDLVPQPLNWPPGFALRRLIDNGNGCTWDPGALDHDAVVGSSVLRQPAAATDTFDRPTIHPTLIELVYTLRCTRVTVP